MNSVNREVKLSKSSDTTDPKRDSYWNDRDIGEAIPWAEELVGICVEPFPLEAGKDRVRARALAYLARSAALLRSMVTLGKARDREGIPILYRTLLETWYHAVYLVEGGQESLTVLESQAAFEAKKIANALELEDPGGTPERLPTRTLADVVQRFLGDEFPSRAYDNHFRIASFHWSHGHLGAISQFITGEDEEGAEVVNADREEFKDGETMTLLLAMGVSLVAGLANRTTSKYGGVDQLRLADFINRWWGLPNL